MTVIKSTVTDYLAKLAERFHMKLYEIDYKHPSAPIGITSKEFVFLCDWPSYKQMLEEKSLIKKNVSPDFYVGKHHYLSMLWLGGNDRITFKINTFA